jgi:hypothetical protein
VLVVSLLALCSPELSFKLMNGHIDAPVSILTSFGTDENMAVLGFRDNLHARIATLATVYNHFDPIDTIVVLGKLRSLFLRVPSDSFGYVDMFTADCEKQNYSP